jgi:maleate isomerase
LSRRPPRIGLIVPSGNAVVETDFHRALGGIATIHATRLDAGTDCTPEAHAGMNEGIAAAARLIGAVAPASVAYACTSGGFENGAAGDRAIVAAIAEAAGAPTASATGAILAALRAADARRVVVVAPYTRELTGTLADVLRGEGFDVAGTRCRGHVRNDDIGAETPEEIAAFASADVPDGVDALVLPCTNWRAFEAAEEIERRTGVVVVTSNRALTAAARDHITTPEEKK